MVLINALKIRAKKFKKEITALYFAYQNPETPLLPKVVIAFTLGYSLSPIDLIPDFIPVIGYLDDLLLVPALISLSIKLIPKEIMVISRKRAEAEPVTLRNNWFFAVLFVLIWVVLFAAVFLSLDFLHSQYWTYALLPEKILDLLHCSCIRG